jgi:hypothetical protein
MSLDWPEQDYASMRQRPDNNRGCLSKTQINFKLIPGVDGHPEIVRRIIDTHHFVADLTPPYGRVRLQ